MTDRLREMIPRLMPERAEKILRFHDDHAEEIIHAKGSSHNHQAWEGGYQTHITQCLVIAADLFQMKQRYLAEGIVGYKKPFKDYAAGTLNIDFTLDEAATVLYFHDVEKPLKYGPYRNRYPEPLLTDSDIWYYGILPHKYGIEFNEAELNALKYVHGEGDDHSKTERKMGPLAAFCHCVDVMSARMYFNNRWARPKE